MPFLLVVLCVLCGASVLGLVVDADFISGHSVVQMHPGMLSMRTWAGDCRMFVLQLVCCLGPRNNWCVGRVNQDVGMVPVYVRTTMKTKIVFPRFA